MGKCSDSVKIKLKINKLIGWLILLPPQVSVDVVRSSLEIIVPFICISIEESSTTLSSTICSQSFQLLNHGNPEILRVTANVPALPPLNSISNASLLIGRSRQANGKDFTNAFSMLFTNLMVRENCGMAESSLGKSYTHRPSAPTKLA